MTDRAYLDWNATAPLRPQARAAMIAALDAVGNPSSVHAEGRAARHLVEAARDAVAALVGAEARNVVFTASGTEANMLALSPRMGGGCSRLLVSAIEHPSVRSGGRFAGAAVETVAVAPTGGLELAELEARTNALSEERGRPRLAVVVRDNQTAVVQRGSEAAPRLL